MKVQMPKLGKEAVPNLQLSDRPELEQFTQEEMKTIPRSAHGKILKNQAAWWGYADIAEAAVKGYRDYIERVFSESNKNRK